MAEKIGTPSTGGMKSALTDFAIGAAGGFLYDVATGILGNGLFGGLAGAALAGSMVKGVRGEIIATTLGFQAGMSLIGGNATQAAEAAPANSNVM